MGRGGRSSSRSSSSRSRSSRSSGGRSSSSRSYRSSSRSYSSSRSSSSRSYSSYDGHSSSSEYKVKPNAVQIKRQLVNVSTQLTQEQKEICFKYLDRKNRHVHLCGTLCMIGMVVIPVSLVFLEVYSVFAVIVVMILSMSLCTSRQETLLKCEDMPNDVKEYVEIATKEASDKEKEASDKEEKEVS